MDVTITVQANVSSVMLQELLEAIADVANTLDENAVVSAEPRRLPESFDVSVERSLRIVGDHGA